MKNIFNNKYIGWILFIIVIAGYSAYYYKTEVLSLLFDSTPIVANDFNTVLYDTDGKLRDLVYIVSEYKNFFIGSEKERNMLNKINKTTGKIIEVIDFGEKLNFYMKKLFHKKMWKKIKK